MWLHTKALTSQGKVLKHYDLTINVQKKFLKRNYVIFGTSQYYYFLFIQNILGRQHFSDISAAARKQFFLRRELGSSEIAHTMDHLRILPGDDFLRCNPSFLFFLKQVNLRWFMFFEQRYT